MELGQKIRDLGYSIERIENVQENLKKLALVKNCLKAQHLEVNAETDWINSEYDKLIINTIQTGFRPKAKLWNKPVMLLVEFDEFSPPRVTLDVDDDHTIVRIDEIIDFLKEIEWDDMLEGIEE